MQNIDLIRPTLAPYMVGSQSPFAFYRGAAGVMACDLARTPVTGLKVQACGFKQL
jgi:Uncharacterized protein conserved in bacteria (DUF2252)